MSPHHYNTYLVAVNSRNNILLVTEYYH
jgi:hypothetical protein